jgi:hypothetical protein
VQAMVGPSSEPEGSQEGPADRRTSHAKERKSQGRRVGPAFNDAQRARKGSVFIQPDGRWIVRGPKGREHVFEPSGQHLTSVDRSQAAHQAKVKKGDRRSVTQEEYQRFQALVK